MAALPPAAPLILNDDAANQLERRLHLHAAVYALLGFSFLFRAAAPRLVDSHLAVGLALSAVAVALSVLSFRLRRFPAAAMAAARIAQVALRAFF